MSTFTASLSTDAWNRPAIGLDTDIGQIGVLDPADVRRGQLTVCERAVDAAEAAELLAMLGIGVGEPGRSGNTVRTEANRRRRVARAARAALTLPTCPSWEPVIWRGGRKDHKRTPMVRDWTSTHPTMRKGLSGAKPAAFNHWILDLLNFKADEDTIDDLFPGTGGLAAALSQPPLSFDGAS